TRSLRIAPVTGTYQHNFFSVQRPGTFTPTGSTVVVRVKSITAGASVVAAVQDQAYTQHPGSAVPLAQNQWTTVTVAIPGTVTSITNLILNFQGVTATSTQPFYVDDLGYGQQSMAPAVVWERIAQAVVSAIRAVDATRPIIVPTYQYSAMQRVSELHPAGPWITDTNIWYQAHSYWDRQRGGFWTNTDGSPESYAQSLAAV
ncbi:MAG: hypothetical protein JWO10_1357, partial [Microbacteriaceae bacterium]|nr:hypothetical protein [Microbacteriaceae bacterium]